MKQQKGFTLVELMIVIAIIGVLMSMALPAYQNYVNKSKLAEVMAFAAKPKAQITEFYAMQGRFPTQTSELERFNLNANYSTHIQSARFITSAGNEITLEITVKLDDVQTNQDIKLNLKASLPTTTSETGTVATATDPNGIVWTCQVSKNAIDFAPLNCEALSI